MKRMLCSAAILLPVFAPAAALPGQTPSGDGMSGNDQKLAEYFRVQTGEIAGRCLADIRSLEDWQARRGEYQRQYDVTREQIQAVLEFAARSLDAQPVP